MATISKIVRHLRERYHFAVDRKRWTEDVRELRWDGPYDKRVLISNLHCLYGGCKFEAILAAALRRLGYRPAVVLSAPDRNIEPLHTAIGETDFYYDRDLVSASDIKRAQDRAMELMGQATGLEDLVNYQIGECRVGRNAMSLAIRRLRQGQLDLNDPTHRGAIHDAFTTSLARIDAYRRLVADIEPERALFNERGYSPSAELFDACLERGIDAIQWLSAPLDDRLLFKRYRISNRGDHPLTLSSESWESICREPWSSQDADRWLAHHKSIYSAGGLYNRQKLQDGKAIVGRQELVEALKLDPSKKIAVIFSHILYDATFFYGRNLFPDYLSWLVETVRVAIKNPHLNWIVKVHPVNLWRSRMDGLPMEQLEVVALEREFGKLPSHIRIMTADTPINTYSLFHVIDYGITVRGTIGMELPCYGIPVVTAGTGRYDGRGFTIDPQTPEEYRNILSRLQEQPRLTQETACAAQRYAFATLHRRSWPMQGCRLVYDRQDAPIAALRTDVQLTETDPDRLFSPDGLGAVAAWLDGTQEDYLCDAPEIPAHAVSRAI